MDYLKYAIRKKYIASAKSYLVPKVLILWDTDVVFRVKLIDGDLAHDTYEHIMELYDRGASAEIIKK